MRLFPLIAGAGLIVAASATAARPEPINAKSEAKLAKILEDRTAGKPVTCLTLRSISSTEVLDGTAIVYHVGNTIYVNRPDGGQSALDTNDIMVTDTHSSQLCRIDVVRLVDRVAWFPTGFVSLGDFVPYTKNDKL